MIQYEDITSIYEFMDRYDVLLLSAPFLLFFLNKIRIQQSEKSSIVIYILGLVILLLSPFLKYSPSSINYLITCGMLTVIFITIQLVDHLSKSNLSLQSIIFNIQSQFSKYPSVYGSLLIAIFLSPPLFRTFDVTDSGYWLSQSLLNFRIGIYAPDISNTWFLSSFITGALLTLLDLLNVGLRGVRILWLTLFIFPIAITIYGLSKLFLRHWLLPFIALATALNITAYSKVPDYELIPSCLASVFIYLLIKSYDSHRIFCFISGFFLGLLLLSRVPAIVIGALFFIAPIYLFIKRQDLQLSKTLLHFIGFFTCILFFVGYLYFSNSLGLYFSSENSTGLHNAKILLDIAILQVTKYFALPSLGLIALFIFSTRLAFKISNSNFFIILFFYLIILPGYLLWDTNPYIPHLFPTLLGTFFIFHFLYFYWRQFPSEQKLRLLGISVAAIIMPWSLMIGSYSGLTKLANGLWLLLPVSLVLALKSQEFLKIKYTKANLFVIVIASLVVLIASGFTTYHRYPYGDHYDRKIMTSSFTNNKLGGIYSTPGRVKSFEELLEKIDLYKDKSKNTHLFAYNNLPMLYYASGLEPLFNVVWITNYSLSRVADIANRICTAHDLTPGLIVRTKIETRSNWGNNHDGPPITEDIIFAKSKMNVLDDGIKKCEGILLWENNDFQLISPTVIF